MVNLILITNERIFIYNPFYFIAKSSERGKIMSFEFSNWKGILSEGKNRFNNLYQYPINIYNLSRLYSNINNHSNYELIRLLQNRMNFKIKFINTSDTFDIASSFEVIKNVESSKVKFLPTIKYMKLFYVMQSSEIETKQLDIFLLNIFDSHGKILFLILMLIITILWYICNKIDANLHSINRKSQKQSILEIILIIFKVYHIIPCDNLKSRHSRFLFISLMFVGIIITGIYQGKLVNMLKDVNMINNMVTLEQIADSNNQIVVITYYDISENQLGNNSSCVTLNSTICRIINKEIINPAYLKDYINVSLKNSDTKNSIIQIDESLANQIISKYFDEKTGMNIFQKIAESPTFYQMSIIIPRFSPYEERLSDLILRATQYGLMAYERRREESEIALNYIKRSVRGFGLNEQLIIIRMFHYKKLFLFYICIVVIASVVFLGELLIAFVFQIKFNI